MIDSYFDAESRPFVNALITLPRFGVSGWVAFLIDTGSDDTCLNPDDGRNIGCSFDDLVNPVEFAGIGGAHTYYIEPATVALREGVAAFTFDIAISISRPHPVADELPSLLGRDIINRLRMDYDFPGGRLALR